MEQDTHNLKRECEEKDAALKELSAFICSKDAATSKVRCLTIHPCFFFIIASRWLSKVHSLTEN